MKPELLKNCGANEVVHPKCRMQVRNSSDCWEIILIFLLWHMVMHTGSYKWCFSCHLIAPTVCLAQISLMWIALYRTHIHIYNVEQLQLNFKLHCSKLCLSRVSAMKLLCCLQQVDLDSFGSEKNSKLLYSSASCHLPSAERRTHYHTLEIKD